MLKKIIMAASFVFLGWAAYPQTAPTVPYITLYNGIEMPQFGLGLNLDHIDFFSHFLMDLDFLFLKCGGPLKRNESSQARKRAKNNMKEWKNKREIITRKIQNSF
ncbi:hypothetical protein [Proteiniphilum sp. X52]|uniref:hypothetical protein n=1 Tax=Proteiniphilum sp. X52 TaxID=2382159 RepID=UPI0011CE2133|nr:hypothetical protein [Proteiniphilum sp. X52]